MKEVICPQIEGELRPSCVGLLFMNDKETRPQFSLFEQSRKLLQQSRQNLSERDLAELIRVVRAVVNVSRGETGGRMAEDSQLVS